MAGTVTNPSGSWSGGSLAGLVDAYTGNWSGFEDPWGAPPPNDSLAQWQHWVLLSAVADACSREGSGGGFAPGEVTLRGLFVGYAQKPNHAETYPATPVTFQADGTWQTDANGTSRQCKVYAMKAKSNGAAGTDKIAVSGTFTLTKADATGYEGTYSVDFGSGLCTGSFVAPWCGTPPA